ncbi:MAG: DUF4260 domain-containing protein [Hyphomicrobium sp.]|jgi:hypothetical protein
MEFGKTMLASGGSSAAPNGSALGVVRLLLQSEGVVATAGSVLAFDTVGGNWWQFALLFLLPDLSMLGYAFNRRIGAAVYNCAHTYLAPTALASLGYLLGHHDLYQVALIWTAHIGFDRVLGYGLKYPEHFGLTHLKSVGR